LLALGILAVLSACAPRSETSKTVPPDGARVLAQQLDADFGRIRADVEELATKFATLYGQPAESFAGVDRSKYAFSANGAFYKTVDDGGAALWISAAVPVTEEVTRVAYMTEAADPWLIDLCKQRPEVSQAYYNDRHSLNRIYPWFDTIAQYPARMNIPDYNFYYLADAKHNPERRGVWVDEPYVDPAGRGWMVSAIAPVYVNERLEGVPGLDVTIASIVGRYLLDDTRAIAVISSQGVLVAATESAIQHLDMPPLKSHKYLETVKLDTFKPDEYNVLKSTVREVRSMSREMMAGKEEGVIKVELAGSPHLVRYAKVKELGWWVLEMDPP
jgi:hypothetical protein